MASSESKDGGVVAEQYGVRPVVAARVLAVRWFRKEMASWLKEPAAVFLNMAYPLLMMVFLFVVGGNSIRDNSQLASEAVAMLGLMGALMVGINLPANGINEVRGSDYYYYIRTLPAGLWVRLVAWSGAPLVLGLMSGLVTLIVGGLVSSAKYSMLQFFFICGVYLALSLACTGVGVFLGFILSKKSSLAVSLGVAFTFLMLSGGRVMADLPVVLDVVSKGIPSTAGVELVRSTLEGSNPGAWWIVNLGMWVFFGLAASLAAIRWDERRRFS